MSFIDRHFEVALPPMAVSLVIVAYNLWQSVLWNDSD